MLNDAFNMYCALTRVRDSFSAFMDAESTIGSEEREASIFLREFNKIRASIWRKMNKSAQRGTTVLSPR
tara:strand:+ start:183 stop:389 length:207 start_codon:yes stop_codon:yes gene_type:complete